MSLGLRHKRNKKVKNLVKRIRNRQIYGDAIHSISEVPREVLESVGNESDTENSTVQNQFSDTHLQFIEIIRLLSDLAQQYQTEEYRRRINTYRLTHPSLSRV